MVVLGARQNIKPLFHNLLSSKTMNIALNLHKKLKGKIELNPKFNVKTKKDLALVYTPGVANACTEIFKDKNNSFILTGRGNALAVITDGSAVLGLGNIGPEAAMPVMEGKALLFKKFGGIDAYPICLSVQDENEIVNIIKSLAPTFGAINLEDIAAPKCFYIEEQLQNLGIPVMHDDQHATAIVALAGLLNALKLVNKKINKVKIVVSGAGAAGFAIIKMLIKFGAENIIVCDRKGIIYKGRENLECNLHKKTISEITNPLNIKGEIKEALKNADVFIGVSQGNILKKEWLREMNEKSIIFALANPVPEIMPEEAKKAGAYIVASGRSDYPNQINNLLAFPGVFRGTLDAGAKIISDEMKIAAIYALSNFVKNPKRDYIIPNALDQNVHNCVAKAVKKICCNG